MLSGGGARGISHIGVIKALEENGIPIDCIGGTSSGALVGAMYAMGYTPNQMEQIVKSHDFTEWANGIVNEDLTYFFRMGAPNSSWINLKLALDSTLQTSLPGSIVNSSPVEFALMERMAPVQGAHGPKFDSLFVPFRCVAADIVSNQQIVFSEGDLAKSVRSSMSYPFFFKPVVDGNMILFDGGIYNNFPADVVLQDFYPDIIIGVNVSSATAIPTADNIVSQIKSMIGKPTTYNVICQNGIVIEPDVSHLPLFDFSNPTLMVQEGHHAAMEKMEEIKDNIRRRVSIAELNTKRAEFRTNLPTLQIDNVVVKGVTADQAEYVRRIVKSTDKTIIIDQLKTGYFKLIIDENIKTVYPTLKYNELSGHYDLLLDIRREKDLIAEFGGNFSSRPINEAYIGLKYNVWGRQSLSLRANSYFGKLYSSLQIAPRLDIPGTTPFYIQPFATLNRWDFFRSSTAFFEDVKPSFLIQNENYYGLTAGVPARNKGKVTASLSYNQLKDQYYQSRNFLVADTADQSNLDAVTANIAFERSTLNRKMYASNGTFFSVSGFYIDGKEKTIPGSTSILRDTIIEYKKWLQLSMVYDNYFKRFGPIKLGYYAHMLFSNEPFFANHTATILKAPAFQPIPEMKTLFLERYRSHNFAGTGIKTVTTVLKNFDFRIEAFVYQPFQEIIEKQNGKSGYASAFSSRYYLATAGLVYNSPLGPLNLSFNYYDKEEEPVSVLFHFGYIIFNKRALE